MQQPLIDSKPSANEATNLFCTVVVAWAMEHGSRNEQCYCTVTVSTVPSGYEITMHTVWLPGLQYQN